MLNKILDLFRKQSADPQLPEDLLFAIFAAKNWTAKFSDLPPDALTAYLDSQAQQLNDTDAAELYSHEANGRTYIPLFSTYDKANAFGQNLYRDFKRADTGIGLMCLPLVQMGRPAMYFRVAATGHPAIIDPGANSAQEVGIEEAKAGASRTAKTEIKKHLIVQKDKAAPAAAPLQEPAPLPSELYALVGNENGLADLRTSSKTEIRAYFENQAEQSSKTEALQLYATRMGDRTFIPLFTTPDLIAQFVDGLFKRHHAARPETSVTVLTQVKMNNSALYDRTIDRTDLALILDPLTPQEKTLLVEDLKCSDAPEITNRTMIWASEKNSNVDQAL